MQQLEFQLNCEYVELKQLLKTVGLCDGGGGLAGTISDVTIHANVNNKTCLHAEEHT